MISINIKAAGVFRRIAEIKDRLTAPFSKVSPLVVVRVVEAIAEHNKRHFRLAQRKRHISLLTAVFSRRKNWIVGENETMPRLLAKTKRLLPLADTQALWNAVTNPMSPFFKVRVTGYSLSVITDLPYASKHVEPTSVNYEFGFTEKVRLFSRVPPPETRVRGEARARGKARAAALKDRPYYKLKGMAEKRYPTYVRSVQRSWIMPMPEDVRAGITRIIADDLIGRSAGL